ncbi:hypothetical protein Sjap_002071 [Stephania japonica]|uniref:Uncharacterized protein n=1 Tax=Stephania japonica TaxID=461633 RepID=A0AAP0KLC8_9MAGN
MERRRNAQTSGIEIRTHGIKSASEEPRKLSKRITLVQKTMADVKFFQTLKVMEGVVEDADLKRMRSRSVKLRLEVLKDADINGGNGSISVKGKGESCCTLLMARENGFCVNGLRWERLALELRIKNLGTSVIGSIPL